MWGVGLCLPKAATQVGNFQGELRQFQAPWRLTATRSWNRVPLLCPCSPRWAALRRSERNISPGRFCALCSSVKSGLLCLCSLLPVRFNACKTGVCIGKTAHWSWLYSEEIYFSMQEGFTWPAITFSAGTDASLCQLWFVGWEGGSRCSRQKGEITNSIYKTPHKLSGGIILHCSWPAVWRLAQFWGSSQVSSAIHSSSM